MPMTVRNNDGSIETVEKFIKRVVFCDNPGGIKGKEKLSDDPKAVASRMANAYMKEHFPDKYKEKLRRNREKNRNSRKLRRAIREASERMDQDV